MSGYFENLTKYSLRVICVDLLYYLPTTDDAMDFESYSIIIVGRQGLYALHLPSKFFGKNLFHEEPAKADTTDIFAVLSRFYQILSEFFTTFYALRTILIAADCRQRATTQNPLDLSSVWVRVPPPAPQNPSIYWGFELFGAQKRCFDPSRLPSSNRGFQNFPALISPAITCFFGLQEVDSEVGGIRSAAV